jgi:membrane-associated phospholipid phosphatase
MSTFRPGFAQRVSCRATAVGGGCVALLAAVYLLAVWTSAGQRFEDAVLRAAGRVAGTTEGARALDILDAIAVPSVVAAALLVLAVGLLRHRVMLGFLGVGVIAASILTAEVMQRLVLRPILLPHGYRREDQSFPSGHTAVAMSVMCALAMVVPYRLRGPVVLLTSVWAASVGVATVTASWHRPSDTIGSGLIAVICVCVAVALLARSGRVREAAPATPTGRVLRALLAGGYGVVAVLGSGVAVVMVSVVLKNPTRDGTGAGILLAGRSLALSGSAAVAVTLLALLRRTDLGTPPVPAEEGSPQGELRHAGVDRSSGP